MVFLDIELEIHDARSCRCYSQLQKYIQSAIGFLSLTQLNSSGRLDCSELSLRVAGIRTLSRSLRKC